MIKYVGYLITVIIFLLGTAIGYGQLKETANFTKNKVEKVESKVEEHEDQINEFEKYGIRQSMMLEAMADSMERQSVIIERLEEKLK